VAPASIRMNWSNAWGSKTAGIANALAMTRSNGPSAIHICCRDLRSSAVMIIGIAVSETSSLPIIFLRIALNISVLMRPPFVGIIGVKKDSSGSA